MPIKSCEVCGSEFNARLSVIRTCGVGCRNKLISKEREQRHKAVKACVICGGQFEVGAQDKNRETCSSECGYKLRGTKTRKGSDLKCVTCGKGFFTSLSRGSKYCSKQCLYDRNKAETTRDCECCGKPFSSPPSQMHIKACSTECGYKLNSGSGHAKYKGATQKVVVDGVEVRRVTPAFSGQYQSRRRALYLNSMMEWASDEAIAAIYRLRDEMTRITGVEHHVDHMVPLIHPRVCGLHNEFNLQVLPKVDNLKKGNRHWPDM